MSAPQNFRSAFNGFNREDVVRYLEYINSKHASELNQLSSEAEYLRNRLEASAASSEEVEELTRQRDELAAQVEELTAQVADLTAKVEENRVSGSAQQELEAYRRAERTERMAKERADLLYHKINGILGEAALKVDGIAGEITTMADQVSAQLDQMKAAVDSSKEALQEAASNLYAIKPGEN